MLSWKSVSGAFRRSALPIGYCVSNLVVMEVGQRHAVARFMGDNITEFQTLLSWKSVSGFYAMRRSAIALKVSNLVVMEVGQRHQAFSSASRQ